MERTEWGGGSALPLTEFSDLGEVSDSRKIVHLLSAAREGRPDSSRIACV